MVKLKDLADQNIWWKFKKGWYEYDKDLKDFRSQPIKIMRKEIEINPGKISTIRGPRRIGKTVLLKNYIKKSIKEKKIEPRQILYFNCETLPSRTPKQLRRLIDLFFELTREYQEKYILLDEITYTADWETVLKSLHDNGQLEDTGVIVTGSLPSTLKERLERLPGRGVEENDYLLKPITFREFVLQLYEFCPQYRNNVKVERSLEELQKILSENIVTLEDINVIKNTANKISPYIEELNELFKVYISIGGFPFVINNYYKSAKNKTVENRIYEEIIRWIEGDLSKAGKRPAVTAEVLRNINERLGTNYSYSALAKGMEEGIQHQTIISYLDLLEASFVLQILHAYDLSHKRPRPKANKKIYYTDPFIYHAINSKITGISGFENTQELLFSEENISVIIEGIIASHLIKANEQPIMREHNTFLWFYYDRTKEIDFIYRNKKGEYIGIEAKYRCETGLKDLKKVDPVKKYILLTKDDLDLENENELVMPVSLFLALLERSEKNL